jgi:hypothetical protein
MHGGVSQQNVVSYFNMAVGLLLARSELLVAVQISFKPRGGGGG